MSSNNGGGVQQFQQPQQIINTSAHTCKECGVCFNSAESLDVHVHYQHENILTKWANKAATSQSEETNNNNTKTNGKREFIPNNTIAAAADSSDSMNKKSPDYSRATPETIFGQPPTPQSYQSAASPYQNPDNSAFSPNFQNYQMKQERNTSPNSHYANNYPNFGEPQFYSMEPNQNQQYPQEFQMHKAPIQNASYRYHPYQYERQQPGTQVSSSSPAFPPQPTPSPSPKQCDKCGYVCDSASQLLEHQNIAHPPTPASHMAGYHHNHFIYNNEPQQTQIKSEEDAQSEILDLDSHKVHQIYPEEEKQRQNGDLNAPNPHSVSALLNAWPQQKMYPQQQHYMNGPPVPQEQKLFMHSSDFMASSVTTTTPEAVMATQGYRAFEHLPTQQQNPSVISSTQVSSNPTTPSAPPSTKSANWKSNEARRPKTYNCTACNKWFTSSGHLKRHYNTTLHKNAVKSSGQPDPASMPISAHHHPARDSNTTKEEQGSPTEEDTNSVPGMMQHPAMPHTGASPPNGEAGPSPTTSLDSRGLLLNSTHGFNLAPMMPIDNSHQFQMYPNGSAPHVTQATDISSLSITGEFGHQDAGDRQDSQPLPSFAQFQRFGLLVGFGDANVGGGGPVTAPYLCYPDPTETAEMRTLPYRTEDDDYRLTLMTAADPASPVHEELLYSSTSLRYDADPPPSPEKAHTRRDCGSPQITSSTSIQPSQQQQQQQQQQHKLKPGDYRCNACDKSFNKACYLTQHNKTFHSGDKPFKCDRCGKRFSDEGAHGRHASKHAGDKPHKCDRCPKQFNHKTDLRRHMCLHSGLKPFVCDTCGKGFIRKDHMLKHGETHFKKTHGKK